MAQYDQKRQGTSLRMHWQWVLVFGVVAGLLLLAAQLIRHFKPQGMPIDSSSILEWTGFIVGVTALVLAIKTDAAVGRTLDGMNEALAGIEKWAKAMPTRHVGPFPDHLEDITNLISATSAGGTLDIIADCADYGSFYAPQLYGKLRAVMANARARNVRIRYLACGELHRFTANSPYFNKVKSDLTAREKAEFSERLQSYLRQSVAISHFADRSRSA
jgi:hypothetical protein